MTVEVGETPCPECGADLQLIYATELAQVLSGLACTSCGFFASERASGSVPTPEDGEYVLLRTETVSARGGDPVAEFRARAEADLDPGEVWLLLDDGDVIEVCAGADIADE